MNHISILLLLLTTTIAPVLAQSDSVPDLDTVASPAVESISTQHLPPRPDSSVAPKPVQSDKPAIAVITIKNGLGVSAQDAELLTDRLSYEIFRTNAVTILERNQISAILKEQGFQQSGACTDNQCIAQMGQLLGVQQIISGSLGRVGSLWMINLRAIDVATGQMSRAVYKDVKGDLDAIIGFLPEIALVITGLQESMSQPVAPGSRGTLTITTTPVPATVYLNGKNAGITPFTDSTLLAGPCIVALEHPLFERFCDTVEITKGRTLKLAPPLTARFASLSITSVPAGAVLFLNRKPWGTTPYVCDTLNPGSYEIKLELPGYKSYTHAVVLKKSAGESFAIELYARGRQIARVAIFGILAAAAGGTGYYFNQQTLLAQSAEHNALAEYQQAGLTQSKYDEAWQRYGEAYARTGNTMLWRNIFYGAAGICGGICVLSIAF